jgi:cobalt-zinc-cadmium efflux system membrane fusion protein
MNMPKQVFKRFVLIMSALILMSCGKNESSQHQSESHQNEAKTEQSHSPSEEKHQGEVHLNEQQMNSLGVKVDTLSGGSAQSTVTRPASLSFDLDQVAKVGPRIEAKVVKVLKDLGDKVKEDEPIALMSSVELGKIKAEYLELKAKLKTEKAHFEREKALYEQNISSRAEYLEAEAHVQEAQARLNASQEALRLYGLTTKDVKNIEAGNEQPLSYFYITSPLSGVIQERALSPGQTISPNETPIHVVDLSKLWVMIDTYEQDIALLNEGQPIELSVRSIPGQTFQGVIDWISYSLEKETRTMPVRAIVANPDGQLRAGMFGKARISTAESLNTALIPIDAVQTIEGKKMVFVPGDEPGSFKPVPVNKGAENEGMVEIASGIQPGEPAVIAGAFDLKSALTATSRSASHGH